MKKIILLALIILLVLGGFYHFKNISSNDQYKKSESSESLVDGGGLEMEPHPLSIEALRQGEYPGSEIKIEQTLDPGSNYSRYIASYKSEGLKIFGLLTIPEGDLLTNAQGDGSGYPAIIFNHGYISPSVYRTTEKYVAYQNAFARNGYVTFKSDYRGHGNSEGDARGGYGSNDYTIDVLNAVSSIKKLKDPSTMLAMAESDPSNVNGQVSIVDADRIGMWGHSMGGHITLESMVVNKDIKAGVIWAGVVGSYDDLFNRWRRRERERDHPTSSPGRRGWWRHVLQQDYGTPDENPEFWRSLSSTSYLDDISGPVQLHHSSSDDHVPAEFSQDLWQLLVNAGKEVEYYEYEGDDHNLSANLSLALSRSVEFFDKYLK